MSSFVTGLVAFLEAAGTAAADRIYPAPLPQGATLPAITYFTVSGPRTRSQDGNSNLVDGRYQLSCWADAYIQAKDLGDEVIGDLSGYKGSAGDKSIQASFIENELDDHEPETGLRRVVLDVKIMHPQEE